MEIRPAASRYELEAQVFCSNVLLAVIDFIAVYKVDCLGIAVCRLTSPGP